MGKGVMLKKKGGENIYPVTASDLVYDPITKKNVKEELGGKVEEAPKNDKQYARVNGSWAEVEAGAVSEVALITLTPAVAELNGVSVKVTTNEGETLLDTTWQGAQLSVQVRAGLQYTVAVGSKDGFIAPQAVTYTAVKGATRSINMAYTESRLKVNILSNQGSDSAISSVKATVKYGSTSVQVANGGSIALPLNVAVTITFPDVTGYKKPETISYTHTSGSYEKSGTYQTEVVSVTLSADNGQSVNGQIVTINGTQHTWNGTVITQKVAFGTEYTVSVNDKDGYTKPADQNFTANNASRDVSMKYEKLVFSATKIRIDQTITDPEAMITRIVDEGGIEAIRSNSHRYTGTFANGKMTLKQLDDANSTKYVDGTSATLTTIGTDVWMKLPQFHWKCSQYATDVWDFEVAYGVKPDDTYKTWDGNDLIGAYEAYNSSSNLYSVSGKDSTGEVSQANFKTYARARGEGFSLVKWKHHCMMAMLYYTMYGHTNCQDKIGKGTNSYDKMTGATNSLGMTDTVAGGNGDSNSINFWGLENWWGNKYEWMDNIVVDARVWKVTEDDGTVRQAGTGGSSNGYTSKILFGENIDLIPTAASGSETTGFCDYYHQSSINSRVVQRSYSYASEDGGVAFVIASYDPSGTSSGLGSRLAFRGDIVIE